MEWLKEGWATKWISSRHWPESVSGEELLKRLQSVEKIGRTPCGSERSKHVTLYLQELTLAFFVSTKWEHDHSKGTDKDTQAYFSTLYSADPAKHLEAYLQHPDSADDIDWSDPFLKRAIENLSDLQNTARANETDCHDLALHASAFLIDNCKLVMRSLAETPKVETRKVSHAIHLLRTLCVAVDRRTPYHEQLAEAPLPAWLPSHPFRTFTDARSLAANSPVEELRHIEKSSSTRQLEMQVTDIHHPMHTADQDKGHCKSLDGKSQQYLRVKLLLEYFGNGNSIPGYQLLVGLIYASVSQKLSLETGEVILRFVSIAIEFLKDHKKIIFLGPCLDMLRYVYACYATRGLDKISLPTVTMIISHLRIIFRSLLPSETAEYLINDMHKRQRDQIMQFLHPQASSQTGSR